MTGEDAHDTKSVDLVKERRTSRVAISCCKGARFGRGFGAHHECRRGGHNPAPPRITAKDPMGWRSAMPADQPKVRGERGGAQPHRNRRNWNVTRKAEECEIVSALDARLGPVLAAPHAVGARVNVAGHTPIALVAHPDARELRAVGSWPPPSSGETMRRGEDLPWRDQRAAAVAAHPDHRFVRLVTKARVGLDSLVPGRRRRSAGDEQHRKLSSRLLRPSSRRS